MTLFGIQVSRSRNNEVADRQQQADADAGKHDQVIIQACLTQVSSRLLSKSSNSCSPNYELFKAIKAFQRDDLFSELRNVKSVGCFELSLVSVSIDAFSDK